jgi:penicillin-binding protein 1A
LQRLVSNSGAPPVVDALIATEDHRFYKHWGLDWRRTASALVLRGRDD